MVGLVGSIFCKQMGDPDLMNNDILEEEVALHSHSL